MKVSFVKSCPGGMHIMAYTLIKDKNQPIVLDLPLIVQHFIIISAYIMKLDVGQ